MGNGTKIGLVLVLILVVVVFATLLDKDIDNAPSGPEQARLNPELGKQLPDTSKEPNGIPADPNRDTRGSANPVPANDGTRLGGDPGPGNRDEDGSGAGRDWEDENFRPRDLSNGGLYNGDDEEDRDRIDLNQGLRPVDGDDPNPGGIVPAVFPPDPDGTGGGDSGNGDLGGGNTGTDPKSDGADPDGGQPENGNQPKASPDFPKTHEVIEGDVLWKLAETYYGKGTLYTLIQNANNIADSEALKIGAKLTIPAPPAGEGASTGGTSGSGDDESGGSSTGEYDRYVIQDGDTLYDIAVDKLGKGTRWEEIRDANPGIDPDVLKVGTTINIPKK